MHGFKQLLIIVMTSLLFACATKGELVYIKPDGVKVTGCETEYSGAPSVDKYAVEYLLVYCAKEAKRRGNTIVDGSLLTIDTSIVKRHDQQPWTFELATAAYDRNELSDREYGYIIGSIDLAIMLQSKQ